jgi:hypothetical protein
MDTLKALNVGNCNLNVDGIAVLASRPSCWDQLTVLDIRWNVSPVRGEEERRILGSMINACKTLAVATPRACVTFVGSENQTNALCAFLIATHNLKFNRPQISEDPATTKQNTLKPPITCLPLEMLQRVADKL